MAWQPPMALPSEDGEEAVLYTRYSSHSQRDVSIEQQIKECTRYAERFGLK